MRAPTLLIALAAAGCTPMTPGTADPAVPPSQTTQCNADAAAALVGQKASAETGGHALSLTGARSLRWGPPGAIFTMDYRPDRVNVIYDAAMAITEIRCG